ncbi:hypothetical protein BRARA_F03153 [Brassica rapa]|uniref:Uncharacterized protein n=1 Tax=Brassica campestris TaxID=3711 RepID=A0A397ZCI7_BRACM|nr:hypothetical protein BRARA_F03153 [Brassica rapa]
MSFSRHSCTRRFDWLSNELLASSRSNTDGFFKTARAIAILCFAPPDNCTHLSPQYVL